MAARRARRGADTLSPSPFDLTGRCAVITGASSGIGQAIAIALATAGADILGLSLDDGAATQAAVADRGGRSAHIVGDTRVPADLERAAAAATGRTGGSTSGSTTLPGHW